MGRSTSRRTATVALVTLGLARTLAAAPSEMGPERLNVFSAVERSLAQHPTVEASAAAVAAARESVEVARASSFPRLDLAGSAIRYQEPMVVTPIHGLDPGTRPEFDATLIQTALSVRYILYDAGARKARVHQGESVAEGARETLEATRRALIAGTVSTFMAVLASSRALAAHDLRLSALDAEVVRVRQLVQVGRAATLELQRAEGAQAGARAERVELAAALDVSERNLARLIGANVAEVRAERLVSASLAAPAERDREQLQEQVLSGNAEVQSARHELRAKEAELALARAGRGPRFDLVANYLSFGSGSGDFSAEWNAGVELNLPLFDGGATSHAIGAAEAGVRRAEEELRLVELEIREALDSTLSALQEAQARFESLTIATEHFAEVVRIEKLRLEQGAGIQTDYLDAEANLLQARAGLAWNRYREISATVELWKLTGELALARLAEVLESGQ